jgi:hypothetical protein
VLFTCNYNNLWHKVQPRGSAGGDALCRYTFAAMIACIPAEQALEALRLSIEDWDEVVGEKAISVTIP